MFSGGGVRPQGLYRAVPSLDEGLRVEDFSDNRRIGPRRVTDVEVVVASDASEMRRCRLRDISIDGAFIETKNFTLTTGAKLDLVLRILHKEKTAACPVPAEVLRVAKDGAALIFGRVDPHVYNILVDIVSMR